MRRTFLVVGPVLCLTLAIGLSGSGGRWSIRAAFEPTGDFAAGDTVDPTRPEKREPTLTVLVAAVEIPSGKTIDAGECTFREFHLEAIPVDAVTSRNQCEGLVTARRLCPGDIVTLRAFRANVGRVVPAGMRVCTIAARFVRTKGGPLEPGDSIDLSVTYQSRTPNGLVTKTKQFMQNVEVFDTRSVRARNADEGAEEIKAKNISLLATPAQANLLKLAERRGDVHFTRRGEDDGS